MTLSRLDSKSIILFVLYTYLTLPFLHLLTPPPFKPTLSCCFLSFVLSLTIEGRLLALEAPFPFCLLFVIHDTTLHGSFLDFSCIYAQDLCFNERTW
jgi:hypothetical protein